MFKTLKTFDHPTAQISLCQQIISGEGGGWYVFYRHETVLRSKVKCVMKYYILTY